MLQVDLIFKVGERERERERGRESVRRIGCAADFEIDDTQIFAFALLVA